MFTQNVHPTSAKDLKVELTLPEEFIGKEVRIVVTSVEEHSTGERLKTDLFFQYLDSLQVDTKGWKFNREEANEQ